MWLYSVKQLHPRLIFYTWGILWRRRGLNWEFIQRTNFNKYYLIGNGIFGETYGYHTGFDIQRTKVVYNVDLDMNRKEDIKYCSR